MDVLNEKKKKLIIRITTFVIAADTENLYWTADYIIPTKDVKIKDYYVADAKLSDHLPVAAVLEFSEK